MKNKMLKQLLRFLEDQGLEIKIKGKDESTLQRDCFAALQQLVEEKGPEIIPQEITALLAGSRPIPTPAPAAGPSPEVRGRITDADGKPREGLSVRVFDVHLRGEKSLLGKTLTDAQGNYVIQYSGDQLVRPEKNRPDIWVEVLDAKGKRRISESPVRFQGQALEIIDIALETREIIPESLKLRNGLAPLLGELRFVDLKKEDLAFLAGSSGVEEKKLSHLVASHNLAEEAKEEGFEVHPDLFFGLLQGELPDTLAALAERSQEDILSALDKAAKEELIEPVGKAQQQEIANLLRRQKIKTLLLPSEDKERLSLGDHLDVLNERIALKVQLQLGAHLLETGEIRNPDFWKKLENDQEIDSKTISALRLSHDLADLTKNNSALMKAVLKVNNVGELEDLAEWTEKDWLGIIKSSVVDKADMDPDQLANNLSDTLEIRFPTRAIASKVALNDRFQSLNAQNQHLQRFFKNNPSFEFLSKDHPARKYVENGSNFKGIPKADIEPLKATLVRLDRLARITPVTRHLEAMIEAGYDSARQIISEGPLSFSDKLVNFTKNKEEITSIYYTIDKRLADVYNFVLSKQAYYDNSLPDVLKQPRDGEDYDPDWSTMFGAENSCDCDDCKSMLSPSAYLADCLNFLKNQTALGEITHLDILMQRRPDIPQTSLTCENTNVQLPYIDLVNEVLEESVASSAFIIKLDKGATEILFKFIKELIKYFNSKSTNYDHQKYKKAKNAFLNLIRPEFMARNLPLGVDVNISANEAITNYLKRLKKLRVGPIKGGNPENAFNISSVLDGALEIFEKSWSYSLISLGNLDLTTVPPEIVTSEDFDILDILNALQSPAKKDDAESKPGSVLESARPSVGANFAKIYLQSEAQEIQIPDKFTFLVLPWPQTGEKTPVLKAHPERINYRAYGKLEKAIYPLSLPFSLVSTEIQAYLKAMEVSPYKLIEYFGLNTKYTDRERLMVMEALHLTDVDWKIITNALEKIEGSRNFQRVAYKPWEYWGFVREDSNKLIDPYDNSAELVGKWDELLGFVTVLLKRASLSYVQLLELLDTFYVNPVIGTGRRIGIAAFDQNFPSGKLEKKANQLPYGDLLCDLSKLRLLGIYKDDGNALLQLLRFLRLANKLEWPYRDLDMFCMAYGIQSEAIPGGPDLNDFTSLAGDKFLTDLGYFQRLKLKLDTETEPLLALYRNINTIHYIDYSGSKPGKFVSLYESLFFNEAVGARAKALAKPNGDLNEALLLEEQLPLLASAFETTTADLQTLITALVGVFEKNPDTSIAFNLNNLSHLYRYSLLANGLGVTAKELLALIKITGINPLPNVVEATDANTNTINQFVKKTWQFLEAADKIKASGFEILELEYLLCEEPGDKAAFHPSKAEVGIVLADIRTNLRKIADEHQLPEAFVKDPQAGLQSLIDLISSKLPLLGWDTDMIRAIVGALKDEERVIVPYTLPNNLPNASPKGLFFNASNNLPQLYLNNPGIFQPNHLPQRPSDIIDAVVPPAAGASTVVMLRRLSNLEYKTLFGLINQLTTNPGDRANLAILFTLCSEDYPLEYIEDGQAQGYLAWRGVMNEVTKDDLVLKFYAAPAPANNDIEQLFKASRKSLLRNFRSIRPEIFEGTFTAEVKIPQSLARKFYTIKNAPAGWRGFSIGALLPAQFDLLVEVNQGIQAELAAMDMLSDTKAWLDPENRFYTKPAFETHILDVSVPTRFQNIAELMLPYLSKVLSEQYLIQKCSDQLGMTPAQTSLLLKEHLLPQAGAITREIQKAIDVFTEDDVFVRSHPNIEVTETNFSSQFNSYYKLHKSAIITQRLPLSPTLLKWMNPANIWLVFDSLLPVPPNNTLFEQWLNTVELASCAYSISEGETLLNKMFDLVKQGLPLPPLPPLTLQEQKKYTDDILKLLAEFLETPQKSVEAYCKHFLGIAPNVDIPLASFKDHRVLYHILQYVAIFKKSGGALNDCIAWANVESTKKESDRSLFDYYLKGLDKKNLDETIRNHNQVQQAANSIKQAFRSLYTEKDWLERAPEVRNRIREQQRNALMTYLLQHYRHPGLYELNQIGNNNTFDNHFKDINDLYGWFLIDVEMGSCMMTTRIKQAISSTQLYIQRVLLQLEQIPADIADPAGSTYLELNEDAAQEWKKWRKWYRVWEANRKILFFPENWMEPSLRDDKTPIFIDFESELLQKELTHDTAVEALRNYILKLDEVGNLEMMGLYVEDKPNGRKETHMIGRTRNLPHKYFYRKCIEYVDTILNASAIEWTPWEKVDLDIEADHVLPVVFNGSLFLFWPTFREKNDEDQPSGRYKDQKQQLKFIELGFNSAEYTYGAWTKRKIDKSKEKIFGESLPIVSGNEKFTFTLANNAIRIIGPEITSSEEEEIIDPNPTVTNNPINPIIYPIERWNNPGTVKADIYFLDKTSGQGIEGLWVDIWNYYRNANKNTPQGTPISKKTQNNGFLFTAHEWGDALRVEFKVRIIPQNYESTCGQLKYYNRITIPNDTNYNKISYYLKQKEEKTVKQKTTTTYRKKSIINYNKDKAYLDFELIHKTKFEISRFQYAMTINMANANYFRENQNFIPKNYYYPVEIIGNFWGLGTIDLNTLKNLPSSKPKILLPIHSNNLVGGNYFYPPLCLEGKIGVFFINKTLLTLIYHEDFITDFLRKIETKVESFFTSENQSFFDDNGNKILRNDKSEYADYIAGWSFMNSLSAANKKEALENLNILSFANSSSVSQYNWELFYHIPLMVATRLSANQRFEEANRWFEFIFDPTPGRTGGKERFWNCRPLHDLAKNTRPLIEELYDNENRMLIERWQDDPFKPYLIARYRWIAFMKSVVVKYLDNLIAWGDQLFRRETLESINEATQIYIIANEILGKRPERVPRVANPVVQNFDTLNIGDESGPASMLSNAIAIAEDLAPPFTTPMTYTKPDPSASAALNGITNMVSTFYFCLPKNDKMLQYWDIVADRLFKIRHCMNIDGIERQLPIFEPPIDPALLVQAAAQGVDISSVLNDLSAPLPIYRFNTMAQKAAEFCNEVRSLGNSLLSALEKRDSEELSRIRADHELKVLQASKEVRKKQIEEATENLESINRSKTITEARRDYYKNLKFMNEGEITHIALTVASSVVQTIAQIIEAASAPVALIPDVTTGGAGVAASPVAVAEVAGGKKASKSMESAAKALSIVASLLGTGASLSATIAGYQRRQEEWKHQENLANLELRQMEKQITAAQIRLALAEKELENHEMQIENTREVNDYMEHKFTNKELYDWMITQLAPVYFQSYQLAYDLAKKAEKAYCHELGIKDAKFIQFGYWDGLKKGLLSGDKLYHDLKRMEAAYLEKNKREYELTKHISLAQLNPAALLELKYKGECFISIPEAIFDLDCPGHYMRRIKNVSLSIPCVVGPYTSVNCTLSLMRSSVRHSNLLSGGKYKRKDEDDPRFTDYQGAIESIVTSSAQNDSGMFETNLKDERFLPFEGAGVISEWKLSLPKQHRQFNYNTISDAIIHLRYTAREGGSNLAENAESNLNDLKKAMAEHGLYRLFSLRYDFPNTFNQMIQDASKEASFAIEQNHFPYFLAAHQNPTILELKVVILNDPDATITLKKGAKSADVGKNGSYKTIGMAKGVNTGNVDMGKVGINGIKGDWKVKCDRNTVQDVLLLFKYQV